MKRFMPTSLTAQMIVVILAALLLAQIFTAWIMFDAHRASLYNSEQWQLIERARFLTQQIEQTPAVFHKSMVKAASVPRANFTLTRQSLLPPSDSLSLDRMFVRKIERQLGSAYRNKVRIQITEYNRSEIFKEYCSPSQENATNIPSWCMYLYRSEPHRSHMGPDMMNRNMMDRNMMNRNMMNRNMMDRDMMYQDRPPNDGDAMFTAVSIQLPDKTWLNLLAQAPSPPPVAAMQTIIYLLSSSALVLLAIAVMVRRITRPLRALSSASNRLGRGEHVELLTETGPSDLRKATRAFNQMNERVDRFIADRTSMLAALSHDLRTPITTLRLRIELLPDSSDKDRLLATLDEMQQMAEATLSFARESVIKEQSRKVSMDALVDSLCEDLSDIGLDVSYTEGPNIITTCRPVSLRRALRNLVENAVKYGDSARVSTTKDKTSVIITIDDDGPGINEQDRERIFEPFIRLENSRNRDTGGIGLGMAIARNIIHAHGGDIQLENRQEGGLRIKVTVPL